MEAASGLARTNLTESSLMQSSIVLILKGFPFFMYMYVFREIFVGVKCSQL